MTMKKLLLSVLTGLTALSMLAGCSGQTPQSSANSPSSQSQPAPATASAFAPESSSTPSSQAPAPAESAPAPAEPEGGKTLVIYFSASGNTRAAAETIASAASADTCELTPVEPYTDADLDWTNQASRVNTEHNDPSHRTALAETPDLSAYDTIFLGYPIWWREAPSIVWNLVENTDLSGKTVIPFCTSTSDGIEGSVETLREMAPATNWQEGRRFGERLDEAAVTEWVNGLVINQ